MLFLKNCCQVPWRNQAFIIKLVFVIILWARIEHHRKDLLHFTSIFQYFVTFSGLCANGKVLSWRIHMFNLFGISRFSSNRCSLRNSFVIIWISVSTKDCLLNLLNRLKCFDKLYFMALEIFQNQARFFSVKWNNEVVYNCNSTNFLTTRMS